MPTKFQERVSVEDGQGGWYTREPTEEDKQRRAEILCWLNQEKPKEECFEVNSN